jgi:phosphohistidine swiveling domain-containing protein
MDLSQKSNTELWQLYEKHDGIHTKLYTYGWLPVAVDMFHNNFTNKLKEYLRSVCAGNKEVEETFVVLCTPTRKTIIAKEREDFLKIFEKYHTVVADAVAKISDKIPAAMRKDLDKHATEWGHLGYIYSGNTDPFGPNHYFQEMVDLAKSGITPKQILDREEKQLEDAEQKKQILYKKIKISPTYKRLFNTANDFALTKLVRRDAQLRDMLLLHRSLLTEIAKRLNITRAQVQFMLQGEIRDALEDGLIDRDKIADRLKNSSVLYTKKDFERIYVGEEAEILRRDIKTEIDHTQTEFRGQTAQPGFAKGTVKIVIRAKDMAKMNQGDILVSIATDPDIVPAMKKAAAIITEQGGITSHAAIVSRELGTPCIIGTKIATKLLKDGDIVEVDANNGVVKILKK